KIACPAAVLFKRFHHEVITWSQSPAAATGCTTMMTTTTFCSSPDTKKQKRRIEVTRDHPVPLPVALVRGNPCHKTGSLFTGSRHHITNRTSQASGLITGVFTRCRPRTAHHQPTGITHMTLPNRDKRPPDTGAVKAHLGGLLNINVKKGSRHC